MPLRDFDQVRERIHLRVEVRHLVQGGVALVAVVGAAFAGGIWYARQQPVAPTVAASPTPGPVAEGLPPAAVALAEAASRVAETPIYPKPATAPAVAALDTPAADAAAAPEPVEEQLATAPGERAVTAAEVAAATPEPAAKPEPAALPQPEPVAKPAPAVAPVAVAKPEPIAKPTPVVVPAAPVPPPAVAKPVAPAPPAVVVKPAAPHGLSLFGTLRMAPTVALVSAMAPTPVAPPPASPAKPPVANKPPVETKPPVVVAHKPPIHQRDDDVRPPPVTSHYVIQIKAIQDAAEAKAFEAELRGKGHAPKLTTYDVPGKGTFYRVRLGPFDSLEAARTAQKQFEAVEGHVTILLGVP